MDNSPAANPIFRDTQGHPLRFFIDVSNIMEGPKLIRSLKRHGGNVVREAKDAQIILVDRNREESVRFAEEWENKLALHFGWVYAAIRTGSYDDTDREWGGYRVGTGALSSALSAISPLPTPRQTPVLEPLPTGVPIPSSQSLSYSRASGSPAIALPASQPQQPLDIPTVLQALSALPQAQPILAQLGASTAIPGLSAVPTVPAVPVPFLQTLLDMLQRNTANGDIVQSDLVLAQLGLLLSQQQSFAQPVGYPAATEFAEPQSISRETSAYDQQRTSRSISRRISADIRDSSRSIERRDTTAFSSDYKGKGRADGSERPRKQRRRDSSISSEDEPPLARQHPTAAPKVTKIFARDDGRPVQFAVNMEVRNRNDLIADIKKHGGKITPEQDNADYIILAAHADCFESELTNTIIQQKPAVRPEFVYECLQEGYLLDPEDYSFHGVAVRAKKNRPGKTIDLHAMRQAHAGGKGRQSKKAGKSGTPRRGRPPKKRARVNNGPRKVSTISVEAPVVANESATPSTSPMQVERVLSTPESEEDELAEDNEMTTEAQVGVPIVPDPRVASSPSPKPPTQPVQFVTAKNLYTKEEHEFFCAYVLHLLKSNPDMPVTGLAKKLHQKVPHHTEMSWNTYCGRAQNKAVIGQNRNKAHILMRKASNNQPQTNGRAQTPPNMASVPSGRQAEASSSTTSAHPNSSTNYVVEDLKIIIEYLAGGLPPDVSDDQIFSQLELQHPCRAAPSWGELWDLYYDTIEAAVRER